MTKITPLLLLQAGQRATDYIRWCHRQDITTITTNPQHDHMRQILENDENDHICEIIFKHASIGDLYCMSRISPIVENKVLNHFTRLRNFDPKEQRDIDRFLTHHGTYR